MGRASGGPEPLIVLVPWPARPVRPETWYSGTASQGLPASKHLTTMTSDEDLVARKNLSAHVQRAMAALSEEQRSTIILKEYQGLTFQEIADLQGCPLSTVKTRLYQGLTVLRRELDRQGIESLAGKKAERP